MASPITPLFLTKEEIGPALNMDNNKRKLLGAGAAIIGAGAVAAATAGLGKKLINGHHAGHCGRPRTRPHQQKCPQTRIYRGGRRLGRAGRGQPRCI